jgi:hypothetical protein
MTRPPASSSAASDGAAGPRPPATPGAATPPGPMPDDAPLPFADLPARPAVHDTSRSDTVAAHEAKGLHRAPDTIWRRNPRDQGLIGFTDAMAYFGAQGFDICVPLIDNQPYDLVIDDGARLQRVQVKTTTRRTEFGVYAVSICTNGGNQSFHTKKHFDPTSCDLLYVLTDGGSRYLIPVEAITSRSSLNLGRRMDPYLVTAGPG